MARGQNQIYMCLDYPDGPTLVPFIVLFYARSVPYASIGTNRAGEIQGVVATTTTVGGSVIPVEWLTWASRTDRMRLRGEDAARLVGEIAARGTTHFRVELEDAPHMSVTYDVRNLIDALVANDMACFTGAGVGR